MHNKKLCHEIESFTRQKDYFSLQEVVNHLRQTNPAYKRLPISVFTKNANNHMAKIKRRRRTNTAEDATKDKRRKTKTSEDENSSHAEVNDDAKDENGPKENAAPVNNDTKNENRNVGRTTFKDLGGLDDMIERLKLDVIAPFHDPDLFKMMGVKPLAGILLHGPPGCGKTKLAHAIANESNVPFYHVPATVLVSGVSGGSEKNIRTLFSKARRTAPSIIFVDEIDAIASKRENAQKEMDQRIVSALLTCMNESEPLGDSANDIEDSDAPSSNTGHVLVIAATNRPDALDKAVRRRFDREIIVGIPDENARFQILKVVTRNLRLDGDLDLAKIAKSTPGFVGSDLKALANEAGFIAARKVLLERKVRLPNKEDSEDWYKQRASPEEKENAFITVAEFEEALKCLQPSTKREGFSTTHNVTWDDVGGLQSLRSKFEFGIVRFIKNPDDYKMFGVKPEISFLLHGPPGCGKTLIAKAVAKESGANFICIKGPELLNMYLGESEKAVRELFSRAKACSPCIIFFDEIDGLAPRRGTAGNQAIDRVVTQLLLELNNAYHEQGVYVIAATNRLEAVDIALRRSERFGEEILVSLPSADDRGKILTTLGRNHPIDASVDLNLIGRDACENFSGADLSRLMNKAAEAAMKERQASNSTLEKSTSHIFVSHC